MAKLKIIFLILKKFIYRISKSTSVNKTIDSFRNFLQQGWVAVNVSFHNLLFIPGYYTLVGFILHILPFIDFARLFYFIGTYDGAFISEDMCGHSMQIFSGNSGAPASSAAFSPNNIPGNFSIPTPTNVGDSEGCSNTSPKVTVSNELKPAEDGVDLNENNKQKPKKVLSTSDYVDIAILTFSLIVQIAWVIVFGIGGNNGN